MAQLIVGVSADGRIVLASPTLNYGASITNACKSGISPLYKADISAIPAGSTITRVQFARNVTAAGSAGQSHVSTRILRDFPEGTGDNTATGDGATWNTWNGVDAWTTAGALGEGTDRLAAEGWSQPNTDAATPFVETIDSDAPSKPQMVAFFQDTLDNYSGIARWIEERASGVIGRTYETKEGTVAPVLTIDYDEPAGGPTPAQMSSVRGRDRARGRAA